MKVAEIMTTPPRQCSPTDNLHTAAEIMWQGDCGCVAVTDEGRHPIGMITDRDICMAAHMEDEPLRARTVESVMSDHVRSCHKTDDLGTVAAIMSANQLRRLPVVDENEQLCGVISINDLALAAAHPADGIDISPEDFTITMAAVCRHRPNPGSAEPH